ncbi:uncharacterized protein METZ01_LOCUS461580, partial [marine metagenome]
MLAAKQKVVAQDVLDGVRGSDEPVVAARGMGSLANLLLKTVESPLVDASTKKRIVEKLSAGFQAPK